jgi:hypothetical protein
MDKLHIYCHYKNKEIIYLQAKYSVFIYFNGNNKMKN